MDIFRTFVRHFADILPTFPFSGLSSDLPVTTTGVPKSEVSGSRKKKRGTKREVKRRKGARDGTGA